MENYQKTLRRCTLQEDIPTDDSKGFCDNEKISFVKDLFNVYFRDQLYGEYRSEDNIILSSGSVNHEIYHIPEALKYFIDYALKKDWYGYSDSRGRLQTRRAIANYENAFFDVDPYDESSVCVTLGATAAIASLFDFISRRQFGKLNQADLAICATPSYPPLAKSMAQHFNVKLVELNFLEDEINLQPIKDLVTSTTPVILLQTVINPCGKKISESSLSELINYVSKNTIIILDECHECFGEKKYNISRTKSNVIRVNSLSKEFLAPGMKLGWFTADRLFIDEYYEYASSNYGSPPSVFYLLLEGLALFEMHRTKAIKVDKNLFSEYDISSGKLDELYRNYVDQTEKNEKLILANRKFTVERMKEAGFDVVEPTHSINVLISVPSEQDSYKIFLDLLQNTRVSVYPGILSFIFSKPYCRISPNIEREILESSLDKIVNFYHG